MYAPCLVIGLWVIGPLAMLGQQVTPDTYTPPPTLSRLMQKDPTINGQNLWVLVSDRVSFRATLEKQASSGKLIAQMLLGEVYIPPECTFRVTA